MAEKDKELDKTTKYKNLQVEAQQLWQKKQR